jgi:hypothetical protein
VVPVGRKLDAASPVANSKVTTARVNHDVSGFLMMARCIAVVTGRYTVSCACQSTSGDALDYKVRLETAAKGKLRVNWGLDKAAKR